MTMAIKSVPSYLTVEEFDMAAVPPGVTISTMSLTFNVGMSFDLDSLWEGLPVEEGGVASVRYHGKCRMPGGGYEEHAGRNFFNSLSVSVSVAPKRELHFKVFRNGSIQAAG